MGVTNLLAIFTRLASRIADKDGGEGDDGREVEREVRIVKSGRRRSSRAIGSLAFIGGVILCLLPVREEPSKGGAAAAAAVFGAGGGRCAGSQASPSDRKVGTSTIIERKGDVGFHLVV